MDVGDLVRDPVDIARLEALARRQIEAGAAELLGDGEALAAELVEIERLEVDGNEEAARLDAALRQRGPQLVAAAAEGLLDADRIHPEDAPGLRRLPRQDQPRNGCKTRLLESTQAPARRDHLAEPLRLRQP